MEKTLLIIFMSSKIYTQCLGDLNQDNIIDTLDIVSVVGIILNNQVGNEISDINHDNTTGILDILILVCCFLLFLIL